MYKYPSKCDIANSVFETGTKTFQMFSLWIVFRSFVASQKSGCNEIEQIQHRAMALVLLLSYILNSCIYVYE